MATVAPSVKAEVEAGEQRRVWSPPAISKRAQWNSLIASLVVVDALMTALAFRLAFFLRFEISIGVFREEVVPWRPFYQGLDYLLIVVWIALLAMTGLYNREHLLGATQEYALVFRASTTGPLLVIIVGFLVPDFIFARGWLLLAWLLTFLFILLGRFSMRRVVYGLRRLGLFTSRALLVGANQEGLSLARQLLGWPTSGLHLVGFADQKLPAGTILVHDLPVLGSPADLDAIIAQHHIEEVILASSAFSSRDNLLDIFQRFGLSKHVNVRLSSGLYEIITTGLTVREFAYVPLVGVNKVRLTGLDETLKMMLDYAITIPGLVVLSPLLALIALAVKLDSPGPVLHRRHVMGAGGRRFDAFKFRTMHVNGDEILASRPDLRLELATHGKLKHDPRITRLGRLLRRTSLDELPQLFNVLRREMSLVGPRMIVPDEMPKYERWGLNLLTVRPGITGLWQVSGRSDISYEQRVQLDMYYIRNWSIWFDLQLLWQTIPAVLGARGAY
jgi:exopolysaccharide biosynthesis polyprenyl glycosylphosphotransferase